MKREDVLLLVQMLNAMMDSAEKMESYLKAKNTEKYALARKEFLDLQKKVDRVLK